MIREFQLIVNNLTQDCLSKVFKLVENSSSEHESQYLPYIPHKTQATAAVSLSFCFSKPLGIDLKIVPVFLAHTSVYYII